MTILTKSIDNDMKSVMTDQNSDNEARFLSLEEAYHMQQEKAVYVERLGHQISQLDEMRQQSKAKARDEVDASVARSSKQIESMQDEFESALNTIEERLKQELS